MSSERDMREMRINVFRGQPALNSLQLGHETDTDNDIRYTDGLVPSADHLPPMRGRNC